MALRTITEIDTFDRTRIEEMAKMATKMKIIGSMYIGSIGPQTVEWRGDELVVTTVHTPSGERT